jgi:hypothetical protein
MSENARYDEGYREGLRDGIELSKDCEGVIAERYERIGRDKGYAAGESERDALRAEVSRLTGEVDVLRRLVEELTDAGECWYDHHGLCQAHSLQEKPCPHERAKRLLSEAGKA